MLFVCVRRSRTHSTTVFPSDETGPDRSVVLSGPQWQIAMTDIVSDGGGGGNSADDPFNLKALREPQTLVQVRDRRLAVPVRRKPNRLDFVRVHPSPDYRVTMPIFKMRSEAGGDEEMYFVHPSQQGAMQDEFRMHTIYTAVNLRGSVFLWCVPLPIDDGREPNNWLVTNRESAELAIQRWVRVASDMGAGAYRIVEYEGPPVEPVWPQESFLELLKLAFKNRMIDRPDHPIILRLRGLG
jgi:hypothetical protein